MSIAERVTRVNLLKEIPPDWSTAADGALSRGWHCFPLYLGPTYGLGGKKQLDFPRRWPEIATADPGEFLRLRLDFERRKGRRPNGYGIVTGVHSGLVVIDVDPRNGDGLGDLEAMLGPLPETYTVLTGDYGDQGRGFHLYFRHPGGPVKSRGLVQGVDVQADGGKCVLGVGNFHPSGVAYSTANKTVKTLSNLPDTWIDYLQEHPDLTLEGPTITDAPEIVGTLAQHRNCRTLELSSGVQGVVTRWRSIRFSEFSGALYNEIVPQLCRHLLGYGLGDVEAETAVNAVINQAVNEGRFPDTADPAKFIRDTLGRFRALKPLDIDRGKFGCYLDKDRPILLPRGVAEGLRKIRQRDTRAVVVLAIALSNWNGRVEQGKAQLARDTVGGWIRYTDPTPRTAHKAYDRAGHLLNKGLNPQSEKCAVPLLVDKVQGYHPRAAGYVEGDTRTWTANTYRVAIPADWNHGDLVDLVDICAELNIPVPTPEIIQAVTALQKQQRKADAGDVKFAPEIPDTAGEIPEVLEYAS